MLKLELKKEMASALQIPAAIAAQILRRQDDGSSGSSAGDAGQDTPDADSDDPCGPSKVSNLGLRVGTKAVCCCYSGKV